MTMSELSKYLSIATGTLYRMVARNEIPAVRLGPNRRTVRFRRDAIDLWIKECETKPDKNK